MSLPSLPLHKFQLSLSIHQPPPPPPPSSLSFKQETMKFQKPEQVEATHPRVKKFFLGTISGGRLFHGGR